MAYTLRPSASGDDLASSRDPIRTNFQIIRDDFAINHVGFDNSGEGQHKFLQMPEQLTWAATGADEGLLNTKVFNGKTELAWSPESTALDGPQYILSGMPVRAAGRFDGTGTGIVAMTGLSFNVASDQVNRTTTSLVTVTFGAALPSANYFVIVQSYDTTTGASTLTSVHTLTAASFIIKGAAALKNNTSFLVLGG